MSHTPGPWKVIGPTMSGLEIVAEGRAAEVATVYDGCRCDNSDAKDNAALICAAPYLLAALTALITAHAGDLNQTTMTAKLHAWDLAHAAVAKAEGRA